MENIKKKQIKENQEIASNPNYSVWTNASAGSGKTTVLIKRLLRMLLNGIEPSKILCITFTNTGAVEMKNRINSQLAKWVSFSDNNLENEIIELEGNSENLKAKVKKARTLFVKILDNADEFKILTIHSFCQQIIKRFPLEANVIPNFKIADEILSSELLLKAEKEFLTVKGNKVENEIKYIFNYINEKQFLEFVKQFLNQKDNLFYLKNVFFTVDGVIEEIAKIFDIKNENLEEIEENFYNETDFLFLNIKIINFINKNGKKSDKNYLEIIQKFKDNKDYLKDYIKIFLTEELSIRKKIITTEIKQEFPEFDLFIKKEAERVYYFIEKRKNLLNLNFTTSFLKIIYCLFEKYDDIKKENGYLDYNDLIFETEKLLNNEKYRNIIGENFYSNWINYKLDDGIDHLLLDEAQDTSPIQWGIINSITEEFFSGFGAKEQNRTIFVVGDEKQSIFSFQGAEPDNFNKMLNYYREKIENCKKDFKEIFLKTSFRSLASILNLTDKIFETEERKNFISKIKEKIEHIVTRKETLGRIELFSLIEKEEEKEKDDGIWKINYLEDIKIKKSQILAKSIADEIEAWFKNGKTIYSRKEKCERLLKYSDIMILIKSRSVLIDYLIKYFNEKKIPIMGVDRFDFKNNIISKDIIALCKFLLFKEDDLNLANIIKSPFLNLKENDLYNLCDYKDKNNCSLWESVKNNCNLKILNFLNDLIKKQKELNIYQLLCYIFEIKNMRKNFKEHFPYSSDEVINEFLRISNDYEINHNNSTLLNFIYFIENTEIIVKRDIEQTNNEIRIITVHSSKGLESPIVILPDTNHTSQTIQKIDKILEYKKNDFYKMPIISREKSDIVNTIKEQMKNESEKEYFRLLYVAITRAENELYVCDYKNKEPKENCWYEIIKESLINMNAKKVFNENFKSESLVIGEEHKFNTSAIKNNKITNDLDEKETNILMEIINKETKEINEIKIINPSTYYDENVIKKVTEKSNILEKGKLVHKLLEILPDLNKKDWVNIIEIYLKDKNDSQEIKNMVLDILNNKNFSFLFGENSKAEVSIFGKIEDNIISGQIDRISIIDNIVYIIDYKTTNFLPDTISQKYIKQLELYKKLLEKIYKGKTIKCYILWTSFAKIEEIKV